VPLGRRPYAFETGDEIELVATVKAKSAFGSIRFKGVSVVTPG